MQDLAPRLQMQAEFTVIHTGDDAEPRRNGEGVVEKVGHRLVGSVMALGRYRPPPGGDQSPARRTSPLLRRGAAPLVRWPDLAGRMTWCNRPMKECHGRPRTNP